MSIAINVLSLGIILQAELASILVTMAATIAFIDRCNAKGNYNAISELTPYLYIMPPSGECVLAVYALKFDKAAQDYKLIFRETTSTGELYWLYLKEVQQMQYLRVLHCELKYAINVTSVNFRTAVEACLTEYLQDFIYRGVNVEEYDGILKRAPFYFMGQFLDSNHLRIDVVKEMTQSANIPVKNYAKLKLTEYLDYLLHLKKDPVDTAHEYSLII